MITAPSWLALQLRQHGVVAASLAVICASCGDSARAERQDGDAASAGSSGVAAGLPLIRFVGRVDTSDGRSARFAWPGTGFVARFRGTTLGVRLTGGQYTVLLDGALRPKLVPTSDTSLVADELPAGEHVLELYRRTEAHLGKSQLFGLELGGGQLLSPAPAPARRIEVIGDSITCGYGNEGVDQHCGFSADTQNHYLTYAALSSRELGAELSTIAWSGKGVVCNYGDDPTSCTNAMPEYYERALPSSFESTWDFARFEPHAVVLNLGTNDFSTASDPSALEFEDAYEDLLRSIRAKYADAAILCTVGPLLNGDDLLRARSGISNAVDRRNALGDVRVSVFELDQVETADGYGCDYHPSLTTHSKMAEQLTRVLKAQLGW